jgi:hypothetical protein
MQIKGFGGETADMRDKMLEMHAVVESCSNQLMEFDRVNRMSS